MREKIFKRYLVEHAHLAPKQRVLDLGCGTGTLTVQIKQFLPEIDMFGLDGDSNVLLIAKRKADDIGANINWQQGLAFDLPYPTGAFDRVISSLMFHHLNASNKLKTFKEVRANLNTWWGVPSSGFW